MSGVSGTCTRIFQIRQSWCTRLEYLRRSTHKRILASLKINSQITAYFLCFKLILNFRGFKIRKAFSKFFIIFRVLICINCCFPRNQELPVEARGDAVSSMVYEADARVRDPVYGCVGAISSLQQQVAHLQTQLAVANAEIVCMRIHNTESSSDCGTPHHMQGSYQQGLSPPLQPQSPELHHYHKPTAYYHRMDNSELAELLWTWLGSTFLTSRSIFSDLFVGCCTYTSDLFLVQAFSPYS